MASHPLKIHHFEHQMTYAVQRGPLQDRSEASLAVKPHNIPALWSFRAFISLAACLALAMAIPRLSTSQVELVVLYYQPLVPQLTLLCLWAVA
eukprot:scaffold643098_cov42-Prasinocladus_malaysianus.AAC.1